MLHFVQHDNLYFQYCVKVALPRTGEDARAYIEFCSHFSVVSVPRGSARRSITLVTY